MLKNYFITALRHFRQHKVFTAINVLGLSVGISSALVIYLIVQYDFSFEKFQKDGDRIYRVVTDVHSSGELFFVAGVTDALPDAADKEVKGLESSAPFYPYRPRVSIRRSSAKPAVFTDQQGISFADGRYFALFSFYDWLSGSPNTALTAPFQVVITESRASTYFPDLAPAHAVGRTITYDDSITATVAGVLKDPQVPTELTFKEFISRSTIYHSGLKARMGAADWSSDGGGQYFVKLQPGIPPQQVEDELAQLRKRFGKNDNSHDYVVQHLQPLYDLHFNRDYGRFNERVAHRPTLYGLILVAAFLLVLGCINFINLTTAQASQRAKEIGIRKTLGSSEKQLVVQFLGETFLVVLFSLLISLTLTPWLLHVFSDFIPKDLHFNIIQHPGLAAFGALLLIVVTFLAGAYPAFVLSGFKPVLVLKNRSIGTGNRSVWLRRTLTVSQFVIAQFFVLGTLIVSRQIRFSLETDLGFKKEGIVFFDTPFPEGNQTMQSLEGYETRRQVLMQNVRAIPGVTMVSEGTEAPSSSYGNITGFVYTDGKKEIRAEVLLLTGDSNYLPLYHIPLLAGHLPHPSDTMKELVINQTYARLLGFNDPRDALGKIVGNIRKYPIIGVMADFHQFSLHEPIKPIGFSAESNWTFRIHVALQPQVAGGANWHTILSEIENAYKNIYHGEDFHLTFFDESIAKFYTSEQQIARLLRWATGVTVLISCLGLLGLVIFSTNLRVKEIGIRKVLGASVTQLVAILSKDFVRLVCIAFLVATPIAWWAGSKWLESFAYRAPFGWWLFPLSGLAMIGLALLVMSIRTIRAAGANPVTSLRSE